MIVGSALITFNVRTTNQIIDDFWFLSDEDRDRIIKKIWRLDSDNQFWPAFRAQDTSDSREHCVEAYNDTSILSLLEERGIKTGIVTSAPSHIIDLELSLLNHNFDAVVRAQDGVKQKPDPDGLMKCIGKLGVNSDKTFYVGNSIDDMKMAGNAKVRGIFLDRGEYNFRKVEAYLTIGSLEALRVIV